MKFDVHEKTSKRYKRRSSNVTRFACNTHDISNHFEMPSKWKSIICIKLRRDDKNKETWQKLIKSWELHRKQSRESAYSGQWKRVAQWSRFVFADQTADVTAFPIGLFAIIWPETDWKRKKKNVPLVFFPAATRSFFRLFLKSRISSLPT